MRKRMVAMLLTSLLVALFGFQVYGSSASSLKIAVYDSDSAGVALIYNDLLAEGYDVDMIDAEDVENGNIFNYDVAVFGGGSTHISDWLASETYRQNLEAYITNGGKYIGICGGGFLGIWIVDGFTLSQALQYLINYGYLLAYDQLDTKGKWLVRWTWGNSFDECGYQYITWAGGTEYSCLLDNGFKVEARYVFDKPLLPYWGKPAIVSGTFGDGAMVLFGPHPEYGYPYPDGADNMHLIIAAVEM
jgi:glutamine amidotransferase-like uncharacterized protein